MSTHTHIQSIRQEMPAVSSSIYLNTGTFGPLPSCVIEAVKKHIQNEWQDGRLGSKGFENISAIYGEARRRVAHLLHANEQEITLTDNTGEGLNIISYGLNWQADDEVITTDHEHISALAPLYQIRARFGVQIRVAELGEQAQRPLREAIQALITPRTRLIVVSHVTWTTGTALDIRSIGQLGREYGIPVLIDGAQSAGNIPINVKDLDVDFYAIPMQKWLCGLDGTGALYIRQEALQYITPTYVGYFSTKHEPGIEWELHEHAQRFELGGRQTAAIAGQCAVLEWLEKFVGYDWLFNRISSLNTYAYQTLKDIPGITILTPQHGTNGILSFKIADHNDTDIVKRLQEEHHIYIRNIPSTQALRVSTGFYNTEEEIDQLAHVLRNL